MFLVKLMLKNPKNQLVQVKVNIPKLIEILTPITEIKLSIKIVKYLI